MTTPSLLNRVERSCSDLRRDDQPITFTAVATRAGLSRSTLYRDTALRTAVNALAARVRTHDEQLRRLTRN